MEQLARLKGQDAQPQLQRELTKLQEQLALLQQHQFGASSEKRPVSAPEPPQQRSQPSQGHGPRPQPELPVQQVVLPLDEADQVCPLCGGPLHEWQGQTEDSEEITVVERQFVLRKVRRQKYRCPTVERQTLWEQLQALAEHLVPSYEALPSEAFSSPLLHADETHWYLLDKGPGKKWYAWTVASADTCNTGFCPAARGPQPKPCWETTRASSWWMGTLPISDYELVEQASVGLAAT